MQISGRSSELCWGAAPSTPHSASGDLRSREAAESRQFRGWVQPRCRHSMWRPGDQADRRRGIARGAGQSAPWPRPPSSSQAGEQGSAFCTPNPCPYLSYARPQCRHTNFSGTCPFPGDPAAVPCTEATACFESLLWRAHPHSPRPENDPKSLSGIIQEGWGAIRGGHKPKPEFWGLWVQIWGEKMRGKLGEPERDTSLSSDTVSRATAQQTRPATSGCCAWTQVPASHSSEPPQEAPLGPPAEGEWERGEGAQ